MRRMLRGWIDSPGRWALAAACAGLMPWPAARANTANWIGNAGVWSNPAGWSSNPFFPNNGNPAGVVYDVTVNIGTVSLDVDVTIQNLNAGGTTLAGTNNMTVTQLLNWSGATLGGSGTITAGNLLVDLINLNDQLAGTCTLISTGTGSTWNSNSNWSVSMQAGATYINQGLLTVNTVGGPTWNGGTFVNQGAISKTSPDTNGISSALNNAGTVTASAGILNLSGGGTHFGAFSATGTGAVNLAGGVHTFSAGASVIGGVLGVTGGTLVLASPAPTQATGISVGGGTIAGSGNMSISQVLILNANSVLGGSGTISAANLVINNVNGNISLTGQRALVNTGTASTWTSNTNWQVNLQPESAFMNQGIFTINTTGGPSWNDGMFLNQGMLGKISSDTNTISAQLQNSGTVSVSAGVLNFSGGGNATGAFATTGTGVVAITGGVFNFNDGASVSGGTLSVLGGTLNLNAAAPSHATNVSISGGTMSGSKDILISQLFTWGASSVLRGTGTITTGNLLISNVGGAVTMADSRTLVSTGTGSSWTSNTSWSVNLGAANTYINQGTLTLATAGAPTWNGGTIVNQGVINKSSSDTNVIGAVLNNSGTISIGAGVVSFSGGGSDAGAFATTGGGVLALSGGVHTFNAGASVTDGTLSLTGGSLVLNGAAAIPAANMLVAGGVLTGHDLAVSGIFTAGAGAMLRGSGTLTAATLAISNVNGNIALADTRTLVATGTGSTWTSNTNWQVNMGPANALINHGAFTINTTGGPTWSGGTINNAGVFAKASSDANIITSVFNNSGTVSVGAGTLTFSGGGTHTGPFSTSGGGQIVFGGGTHTFNAGVSIANIAVTGGAVNINPGAALNGGTLTVTGGQVNLNTGGSASKLNAVAVNVASGRIDLKSSPLIVQSSGSSDKSGKISALNAAISAGAAGGSWTGSGITSSTAAADAAHLGVGLFDNALLGRSNFGGIGNVDANSILVAVAHLGDANRSGIVDIQDQSIVTNHWQSLQNNWAAGDLNRDGFVDLQDLTLVTNNWQQSSPFSEQAAPVGGDASPNAAMLSVPEPGTLMALGAGVLVLSWRRIRTKSGFSEPR